MKNSPNGKQGQWINKIVKPYLHLVKSNAENAEV